MIEPKGFEDLLRKLNKLLPEGVEEIQGELRANFKAAVSASLAKMELVTREEFDVQRAVLARTREKLSALEDRVRALESALTKDE